MVSDFLRKGRGRVSLFQVSLFIHKEGKLVSMCPIMSHWPDLGHTEIPRSIADREGWNSFDWIKPIMIHLVGSERDLLS